MLHDVVDAPAPPYPIGGPDRHDDDAMRPNQLLAWSLPHAPLAPDPVALKTPPWTDRFFDAGAEDEVVSAMVAYTLKELGRMERRFTKDSPGRSNPWHPLARHSRWRRWARAAPRRRLAPTRRSFPLHPLDLWAPALQLERGLALRWRGSWSRRRRC